MVIDILTYLVHLLVFSQPFIWWWFYNQHFKIPRIIDYLAAYLTVQVIFMVIALGIQYEFYKTHLIVQYIIMLFLSYRIFASRMDISDSIALAFLTVYMNSYYWESVLHFQEYTMHILAGSIFINYRELWRLIPILFFIRKFKFDKEHTFDLLTKGLMFSALIAMYNFGWYRDYNLLAYGVRLYQIRNFMFFLNRIVCEFIIVKVILDSEKIENDENLANQDMVVLQEREK